MLGRVFAQDRFHWVERRHPLQWLGDLWSRFLRWVQGIDRAHPVFADVLFYAALVVLVVLLTHIGYTLWRIYRVTARPADVPARGAGGVALQDGRAHRARAEALAREGRYAEALAHRFAALVCDLGDARAVTIHASKTPAEYAREARLDAVGRVTLAGLVATLYGHLFGGEPVDDAGYRRFAGTADLVLDRVGTR